MPRKTKEINEEKSVKKQTKSNNKTDDSIKVVLDSSEKSTKKTSKTKSSEKIAKASTAKSSKTGVSVAKTSKSKKSAEKDTKAKTSKKASATKPKTTNASKVKSVKAKKVTKVVAPTVVEYYDLPYKYNQTVVKVLYQNPTTLFVYWEISDNDIENYKKIYGDNFFETTRPALIVYNDTMNYHFEIDINDFANCWYFNIDDRKCDYRVELVRRPAFYNEKIKTNYIHITSSNEIESPNDKILFSTNEPYTVYFRNTKNNSQRKVNLPKLLEKLNLTNKDFGFPIVRNIYDLYKNIYHIEDVGEFSISLTKPSSGNPSSHSLSSKFI